ncbi:MAG: DUF4129 domain-containing protein [Chloroflexi bacterium]|nr:DUF4129 domain-containing protein [Chloroflexota bacterium]
MKIFPRVFSLLVVVAAFLGFAVVSASASSINNIADLKTGGNFAIREDDYWIMVQSTRAAVDRLKGLSDGKIKEGLASLAHEWESITEVEMDGQAVSVDNKYLFTLLSADTPDLDQISGLLDALLVAHEKYPNKVFSAADIEPLNIILSRPEFQWPEKAPNPVNDWLQKLLETLYRWWNSIFGGRQFTIPMDNVLLSTVASILLAVVLFYVFRSLFVDFMKEAQINGEEGGNGEPLTSEAAFEKAQGLSRGGDYRSAVRYLYLSSLLLMDERGVLRFDRSKTNHEYLRSVANSPELAKPLEEVIEVFDNVWYGYHSLEEESFKYYSARVEELKEKKP